MQPGCNPRLNGLDVARSYWVLMLPEKPKVARLVFENGQWFLVVDGSRVPVSLEGVATRLQPSDTLPEPDYDAFLSWCLKGTSLETCRRYRSYLERLPWPLRIEDLYRIELNKWMLLALRAYLNFLEGRGYDVTRWRRLRALRVPKSNKDRYVPSVDEVRRSLERLSGVYRLVYYVILYTGFRLEHAIRLLGSWGELRSRAQGIPGSCVRIVLPPGWGEGVKREFYAYMPKWLYDVIDLRVGGYRIPRRESISRRARKDGAVAPKYLRKFALSIAARILSPDAAAHMAGHEEGAELIAIPKAARTGITVERYASIEDLVKNEYWRYARWLEENVASRSLLESS